MSRRWYFALLFRLCGFIVLTSGLSDTYEITDPQKNPNLLIADYIKECGYPFELHHVTTKDGYILALHRIPYNTNDVNATKNRGVVLIMHGLLGSSADWLLTGQNRSIAYLLADNGYDVWLGNARGTTNSKNHITLSTKNRRFWDFSWHEMGIYDTPAMIDYILDCTGEKQLFYVGFSQGTTQFWVLMSLKPEYNKKIKLMSALAPVAYTGHISGLLKPLSFFGNLFKGFYQFTGYFELLANTLMMKRMGYRICRKGAITQPLCELIIFTIGGFSNGEMDHTHLAKFLQYVPAGCSFKQLIHYAMGIQNPGHFRPYDYGTLANLRIYKQHIPPEYPIEKITAPVILYNGLNDWLAHPKDVEILRTKLPNIVENYTVTLKRLNHFDFIFGNHVRNLVYNHLIQQMNSMTSKDNSILINEPPQLE